MDSITIKVAILSGIHKKCYIFARNREFVGRYFILFLISNDTSAYVKVYTFLKIFGTAAAHKKNLKSSSQS
jgi:hypothetical protein